MNFQEKIDRINSLRLDEAINFYEDLILDAETYLRSVGFDEQLLRNFIDCFQRIRSSRHIESDTDIKLLDISLKLSRKLSSSDNIIGSILKDMLYYSEYYPEKYKRDLIEKELNKIRNKV